MSKIPWKLVGPIVGMILTYVVATYAEFDLCTTLWPDRCAALPAAPPPAPAPVEVEVPDAGK